MADTKISALTEDTSLLGTDEFAIATAGASRRVKLSTLFGFIQDQLAGAATGTVDPDNNDDASAGFVIGSIYVNTDTWQGFVCVDNTVGAAAWLPVSFPPAGYKNQVLAKASANDGDVAWLKRMPLHPGYFSQKFYNGILTSSAVAANNVVTANTVYYTPLFIGSRVTIDQLLVRTGSSNATAGNVLIGIYNSNPATGAPTDRVFAASSAAIPNTANTNVVIDLTGSPLTLDEGFYWWGISLDNSSITMQAETVQSRHAMFFHGQANSANIFTTTSLGLGFSQAPGSFTLPSTATPTWFANGFGSNGNAVTGIFRVQ